MIKKLVIQFSKRVIKMAVKTAENELRDRHNVDIVLSWALQKSSSNRDIHFPPAYIELLRSCIERKNLRIRQIKADSGGNDTTYGRRFSALVDALAGDLPPIEVSIAEEIAIIADSLRKNMRPVEIGQWAGDIGVHIENSSSVGMKGRILATVVRFSQSKRFLELGTGYGITGLFFLEPFKNGAPSGRLTIIEGDKTAFSIASEILKTRYEEQVSCHFGWAAEALPKLVKSLEGVDFLFHDAGHSKEDYVRDFNAALPILKPGAVVLIDDIRWNDPRFSTGNPRCYEGWLEVVKHPRVRRAVEISDILGLLLLHE